MALFSFRQLPRDRQRRHRQVHRQVRPWQPAPQGHVQAAAAPGFRRLRQRSGRRFRIHEDGVGEFAHSGKILSTV